MRYTATIALYALLSGVWVYWVLDRQLVYGDDTATWAVLAVVGAVHVAFGFALGRWWAVLLPLLAVAMAAPIGYPSANRGEPFPVWFSVGLMAPIEMLLLAVGVGLRLLVARRASIRWS